MNTVLKISVLLAGIIAGSTACHKLDGDNSDFDLGFGQGDGAENPYVNGYDRLENSLRIATYNLHRCEGPVTQDPSIDQSHYDQTAKVISLVNPDIIALQELDENTSWHPVSQIQELASRTGLHPTFGKAIDQRGGQYGNGILSREKPLRTEIVQLPNPDNTEKRIALVAEFEDYVFIATHFCHKSETNRTEQAKTINEYVETHYKTSAKRIFLGGDLNTNKTSAAPVVELLKNWSIISSNDFTMSTGNTRIDYVMIYTGNSPDYTVLGAAVPTFEEVDVYTVSDHLPVFADVNE